jgi:hypothetical protein
MEPLIVTLKLDADTFARFERLRREHFPAKLNHLSAHLTLFHHLPGEERDRVEADLRAELARRWAQWLTPQDRQGFRPHVTVQNKVPVEEARALKASLEAGFSPLEARGEGLLLWRYLGGPWALETEVPFAFTLRQ